MCAIAYYCWNGCLQVGMCAIAYNVQLNVCLTLKLKLTVQPTNPKSVNIARLFFYLQAIFGL